MGSGGPRGLQILRSVADRGRGGFDSHTFPPLIALALTLGLVFLAIGSPATCRAQGVDADTTGIAAPSPPPAPVAPPVPQAVPDSAAAGERRNARGERERPWHEQPWSIMTRSALLPGWGQWENGRPWKALGVTALELGAGWATLSAHRDAEDALERRDAAEAALDDVAYAQASADYDEAYNRRTTWAWILGTTLALSMLDAYVDAHLLQFDADFGPDPEPLSDLEAATGRSHGGISDLRAGVRLNFTGP